MADRAKDCKISFSEMPRKNFSSVYYKIEIPNFFTLPEFDDTECVIKSMTFKFAKALWEFSFSSRTVADGEWVKGLSVRLNRLKSEECSHYLYYTILLIDSNDKIYDNSSSAKPFYEFARPERWLYSFSNKKLFYDRRDTLTLHIHLICNKPPDVNVIQEPLSTNREMAERGNDSRISLSELPMKQNASVHYMMTITNVSSLFQPYNELKSPSFGFANATWQFHSEPEIRFQGTAQEYIPYIIIYLTRLNSEIQKHLLFFDTYGHIFSDRGKCVDISDDSEKIRIGIFAKGWIEYNDDTLNFSVDLIWEEPPEINTVQEQLAINKEMAELRI